MGSLSTRTRSGGGLYIFKAKRYTKMVGLEAVQALAGVVEDKNAAKGILVTTSWAGKASLDFAARNGRIEIIDGPRLKSMLRVHLGLDVRISLPGLRPDWEQDDVLLADRSIEKHSVSGLATRSRPP